MSGPALATRAHGLSTRLLPPGVLEALDGAGQHAALASELAARGYPIAAVTSATADEIDRAIVARESADLAVLERWGGDDGALAVLREDSDRRSLRAIGREIAGRGAAGGRLEGAAPTRTLPARALAELEDATTAAQVRRVLARLDHPYADLVPDDEPLEPLSFEHALARRFAERAREHARGSRSITRYVEQTIDGFDATAALLLCERSGELEAGDFYLPGGQRIERETFVAAAGATPADARRLLAKRLDGTPLAAALAGAAMHALENALLEWQLAEQTALVRREPISDAAVLWLALRRRDESRRLRRAIWRVALGGRS